MYHNAVCSKSRGALDILRDRGVELDVIDYLDEPLSRDDFERILDLLPDAPAELVRKDKRFKELGLDEADYQTREQVIDLLLEHPVLMQRPVVVLGDRALIARPSEKVLELLD
jgi:arsenate reductase